MALGRSLGALLSESDSARQRKESRVLNEAAKLPNFKEREALVLEKGAMVKLPLEKLVPSKYQPRRYFEETALNELAESIREHGLLEPLIVRKNNDESFEIICGERRFRACRIAGLKEIPCLISDVLEKDAYAVALVENLQRQDLNPIEEAQAYSLVIKECGITQEELAKSLGKSRSSVANMLRLNALDEKVKEHVIKKDLDMGHARALAAIEDAALQAKTADYVAAKGLSVRQTELLVKEIKENDHSSEEQGAKAKPNKPVVFDEYEKKLADDLGGAKVKFSVQGENRGKLTLSYASAEQLEAILGLLGLDKKS